MSALPQTYELSDATSMAIPCPKLTPDLDQAKQFLEWLEPFAEGYTFQTFADTPKAKAEEKQRERSGEPKRYARQFHGPLSDHAAELERLNTIGAGVFVCINETDFKGRKEENIKRVRAVFSDTDGAPLEPHLACELKPSAIIETSRQSWHVYWACDELPLDKFQGVQWRIADQFGADKSVNDLPRVMRLPGFWHRKGEPYQVRIVGELDHGSYSAEQILATFPPMSRRPKAKPNAKQPPQRPQEQPQAAADATALPDDEHTLSELSEAVRTRLLQGVPDGERSEAIFGVAKDLIKLGLADDEVARILTEPRYQLSAKAYECGRTTRNEAIQWTLDYTVKNARIDVEKDITSIFSDTPPADLFSVFEPPPFPADLLPSAVADYASDQAELIGVDPAVIGMAAIAAIAGCIDDRIKIQPKRRDPTWRESARLWVGIIGDPSAKKTPGINKALGPIRKVAYEKRREYQKAVQEWAEEVERLRAEQGKGAELPDEPKLQRFTASDVTVEKLGDILSEGEPRGILIDRDELTGWLASHDAYKAGAGGKDKAAWLEAYNGGPLEIDRVVRGSLWVENWSACIVGGIQPDVIHNYAQSTNHDGLLQRFLLIHAGPARMGVDRHPDMDAKQQYTDLIEQIVSMEPPAEDSAVRLSDEAHQIREKLYLDLNRALNNLPNKHLSAMLGKWEGTFARLLLTFHVAECAGWHDYPTQREVNGNTAQKVATLMWKVLLPHAVRFYEGLDPTQSNARDLAALLLARGWERFTVRRDLDRNMLAYRKMREWEREQMLDRLSAFGWISPEPGKLNERGRPIAYLVNPEIHNRYAEHAAQERERRAEVTRIMQELKQ